METYKAYVEEIISLYSILDYNRDMFALRYPLNINYRSFETLANIVSCRDRFVIIIIVMEPKIHIRERLKLFIILLS